MDTRHIYGRQHRLRTFDGDETYTIMNGYCRDPLLYETTGIHKHLVGTQLTNGWVVVGKLMAGSSV